MFALAASCCAPFRRRCFAHLVAVSAFHVATSRPTLACSFAERAFSFAWSASASGELPNSSLRRETHVAQGNVVLKDANALSMAWALHTIPAEMPPCIVWPWIRADSSSDHVSGPDTSCATWFASAPHRDVIAVVLWAASACSGKIMVSNKPARLDRV